MTPAELEAALRKAFGTCDAAGSPLTLQQQQILLQALIGLDNSPLSGGLTPAPLAPDSANPLDELTPDQRHALLQFIAEQNRLHRSWKAQLLNDWLHNRDSGDMQFIREQYGIAWLERVQSAHLSEYAEQLLTLKVGDRIEVSNGLWEWIQEDGPCSQEWFVCTVVNISEIVDPTAIAASGYSHYTSCTIRFDNGMEYQIQGMYEWNRYQWRWVGEEW